MNVQTIFLILLAAILAMGLVLFQYRSRSKKKGRLPLILSLLRFMTWFGALLLLINPKFTKNTYTLQKAKLLILADNSSSIMGTDELSLAQIIKEDQRLGERFDMNFHSFGGQLNDNDSLTFTEKNTNISAALKTLRSIYGGAQGTMLLLTDGNQTLGDDYEYNGKDLGIPIFPIVVGDTTRYEDLRIGQVNSNKYAFLNNKYPIEVFVSYEGDANVSETLTISVNGKLVYREQIKLSGTSRTKVVNTLLEANTVGTNNVVVAIGNLENERNTANNNREVAVEVVDEKTNIVIISDMQHPDIGALKKSIESNEQRSVSISIPTADSKGWDDVDLFILYQPTQNFRAVYKYLQQRKANSFTITGSKTDWGFLNKIQSSFLANSYYQSEELLPKLNAGFTIFNISDFSTIDFPPLEGTLGEITVLKPNEMVMTQRIKGVDLNQPLLAVMATDLEREAVLFGENIWKWRMQSYRNDQNFNNFDTFMGKLVLFLATTNAKNRMSIEFETVYQGNGDAKIKATYFDKTFVFDPNANITLELIERNQQHRREFPMLLKNGYYETDLTDLPPGKYTFTAKVASENLSRSGAFTVLDFNVEQQFLSSDYKKLDRFAVSTKGKIFYPDQLQRLIEELSTSDRFSPTQKSEQNVVSLIDFRFLLGIIAAALSLEWFIRKYNGLI